MISDWSRGLILFWYSWFLYVVCNPVTKKWLLLSGSNHSCSSACFRFDPTVSHFHVFEYGINDDNSLGVNIYSSKTRAWIFKESEWGEGIVVSTHGKGVFVNGFMHMLEFTQIVAVDMEGKTWRKICRPRGEAISIHQAQGQLYLCTASMFRKYQLLFWILEDYGIDN